MIYQAIKTEEAIFTYSLSVLSNLRLGGFDVVGQFIDRNTYESGCEVAGTGSQRLVVQFFDAFITQLIRGK